MQKSHSYLLMLIVNKSWKTQLLYIPNLTEISRK